MISIENAANKELQFQLTLSNSDVWILLYYCLIELCCRVPKLKNIAKLHKSVIHKMRMKIY